MPHLTWNEVKDRAIRFSREHAGDRSERAEKQTFWNDFFNVFGLRRASLASFEENVRNLEGHFDAIDLLWKGRLLVEHKSFGEDLKLAKTQAFRYIEDLTREDRWDEIPRYVLVSDFAHFVLYDLEPEEQRDLPLFDRKYPTHHFTLAEFPKNIRAFAFMLGQTRVRYEAEPEANQKAYDRICKLHDELKAGGFTGHELERLLVRILFCMFAEDTLIFEPEVFTRFVRIQTRENGSDLGAKLNELFDWLNNPAADKLRDENDPFYGFRWVNGGLFEKRLGFPHFNKDMRDALLYCCDFQWARISPAVFGSLFQGVMEDRARRQIGAQYTSERDIMKVVHSLFLDDLRAEWTRLCADRSTRRRAGMEAFHQRLRSLQFLDPACGCGNFLVLAYRELRLLEIEVVRELSAGGGGQKLLPIVNVDQFHGIEILEWPVRIAEVALWLMDHQMNRQTSEVFGQPVDRLPLTTSPHIVQGNALRKDWNEVLPRAQCSYVLGNPPFVGKKEQNTEQKSDMDLIWNDEEGTGVLDYVTCWYVKASDYIRDTKICVTFVSTNSISQGEQVGVFWRGLRKRNTLYIHFAHRSFAWQSEARGKAHVHVVIIGFAAFDVPNKTIFEYAHSKAEPFAVPAKRINPYLADAVDVLLFKRGKPLCDVPEINYGSMANDRRKKDKGLGNLILDRENRAAILDETPKLEPFIRPFIGSEEFLNSTERWCLWLVDAPPALIRESKIVTKRIEAVREARLESGRAETVNLAATPALFGEIRQPTTNYLLLPKVSSEERPYMPLGFLTPRFIANGSSLIIPKADEYEFGILSSVIHMAWMRYTGGRMKSDYQYSSQIVYNNFPWPAVKAKQRKRVEEKARAVLAAREKYMDWGARASRPQRSAFSPDASSRANSSGGTPDDATGTVALPKTATLADLYDPNTMPRELLKAHTDLDRAVEKCYRPEPFHSDRERVEFLFSLYEKLTAPLLPVTPKTRGRRSTASTRQPKGKGKTPGLYAQKLPKGKSTPQSEADAAKFHFLHDKPEDSEQL